MVVRAPPGPPVGPGAHGSDKMSCTVPAMPRARVPTGGRVPAGAVRRDPPRSRRAPRRPAAEQRARPGRLLVGAILGLALLWPAGPTAAQGPRRGTDDAGWSARRMRRTALSGRVTGACSARCRTRLAWATTLRRSASGSSPARAPVRSAAASPPWPRGGAASPPVRRVDGRAPSSIATAASSASPRPNGICVSARPAVMPCRSSRTGSGADAIRWRGSRGHGGLPTARHRPLRPGPPGRAGHGRRDRRPGVRGRRDRSPQAARSCRQARRCHAAAHRGGQSARRTAATWMARQSDRPRRR